MAESDKPGGGAATTTTAEPKQKTRKPPSTTPSKTKRKPRKLPPYNVVLLDDDDHSYDYVIEMLAAVFGHPLERGMQMAKEVDSTGRVIVLTTHKELAELKRDQILGYGADFRIMSC